ncbi:carbohydrate esterase family 4 protein [Hydnum rufescens UP504]|uniref:Carbohydrate esterase family 4 protein n=1 Tax=Hydnum rufescens UP504 TaxID=1448309 RepID=A0A9P6B5N9_9AGAM|nr:carbohydrate esterase family 4 protein [Hydnum rufescens UP504]
MVRTCGYMVSPSPWLLQEVKCTYAQGHQLVSHTWSHPDLTKPSFDQIHNEMWRIEQALERIVGVSPAFIRLPYRNYNNLVREVAKQRNQSVHHVGFEHRRLPRSRCCTIEKVYAVAKNPRNILALNHETYSGTAETIVSYAIKVLQRKGYRLVTVAECPGGLAPYQWTAPPQTSVPSWTC